MKQQNLYNVAIYCRLSRDDEVMGESSSISTQKEMLTGYVESKGWRIAEYYIDDGISGTTFERDGFNKMIQDIEAEKINMVVTKDLSRLGRDYLKTGFYTECFFPENNVRYIAVNDGIDTIKNDNDIAPFKNILNEMYAKDISKKIKSAYKVKIERGDFHGAYAPLGYAKDPVRKGKLKIDLESSKTIQYIFSLAKKGFGAARIRTALVNQKYYTPSAYLNKLDPAYYSKMYNGDNPSIPYAWSTGMVDRILHNEIYIGNTIHYKEISVSYKTKRRQIQPKDKWHRSMKTHEAIIDKDTWDLVQERYKNRGVLPRVNPPNIFQRIARCADCGKAMWLAVHQKNKLTGVKTDRSYLHCVTYRQFGAIKCKMHSTSYKALYHHVLNEILNYATLAKEKPDMLMSMLNGSDNVFKIEKAKSLEFERIETETRLSDISILLKKSI